MELTPKQYREFTVLYKIAVELKKESFVFYGQEILTEYAKHLLTYYNLKNDRL